VLVRWHVKQASFTETTGFIGRDRCTVDLVGWLVTFQT